MKTLITGASSGLGAEMARQFADLGHDLVLTARRLDRLEHLRAEILSQHPTRSVEVMALDVQDADAVFDVFRATAPLDRVIVNAGQGYSEAIGTGGHQQNRTVAMTNFVGGLTQIEAAMEQFRAQGTGHLVVISSIAAARGQRGNPAVYSATKRGIAHLAESMRSETLNTDIRVTVVYPGYIRSEMTANLADAPFTVDTDIGVRAMVKGIERHRVAVYAPTWPWRPLSVALKILPLRVVSRVMAPAKRVPADPRAESP